MIFKKINLNAIDDVTLLYQMIEGLNIAQAKLDERYKKKEISLEDYKIQAAEFGKRRAQYQKELDKLLKNKK